ncbi:MAG TPA: mechanosensitive ion channel family protein, partial [Candidatus Limnocylindria bacterium]|nr:mechanosensitive ion channel family protein [Candidatus Limnocylindria bacterium]
QYLATILYIILAFYVAKFVDWFTHARLKKWAAKTETEWDDIIINLLDGPVKVIVFVILVHMGLAIFDWTGRSEIWVSKITTIIVAFAIITVVLRAVDALIEIWLKGKTGTDGEMKFNQHFLFLMGRLFKGFVFIVATLTTLDHLGFDIKTALASVSVVGLALGLAAQDTVSNLFGAVSVFVDKPFQIGDRIRVADVDGTVEQMGLRSTRVRSLDGFLITVPNKTIGNATIVNITRRPTIKTELNFGVTYDTTADQVKRAADLLTEIFKNHPKTHDVIVTFNKFLDSALNIQVVYWGKGTDARANLADLQELNLEVKRRFDAEGLEFAFPTQTVIHRGLTDAKPPLPAVPANNLP